MPLKLGFGSLLTEKGVVENRLIDVAAVDQVHSVTAHIGDRQSHAADLPLQSKVPLLEVGDAQVRIET
jgi:hypothetical protein